MATRFSDHLLTGVIGDRPAATAVPAGTLYASTDEGLVYQSDGTSWDTWISAGGGAAPDLAAVLAEGADAGGVAILNSPVAINTQSASYTLVLTDAGKLVSVSNASANNLTVPLNSSVAFPTGTIILVKQAGAGQTTVVATGGVTVSSRGAALKLAGQHAYATLVKTGTDTWDLSGDITT